MIIFYNKQTGNIIGKVDGRKHSEHVLNKVWIGNRETTEKMIIDWQRTGCEFEEEYSQTHYEQIGVLENGNPVLKPITQILTKTKKEYEPQCKQKKLLTDIERGNKNIFDYKIKNSKLVKK